DGVRRLEAEDDHEDRRHQRAAAHPGEPDDRADQQPREDELPGNALAPTTMPAPTVSFVASSMRMKEPVSRFSAYGSTQSGSDRRRRTRPMSFRPSCAGAATF